MHSRFNHLRATAIGFRREGKSIRWVEQELNIPRSTLSGWFRDIQLNKKQKERLHKEWINGLSTARTKAVLRHKELKQLRISAAFDEAKTVLKRVDVADDAILEIILAMLYWGEGAKTRNRLLMGNSDPKLLKFFLDGVTRVYKLPRNSVRCALHLRADQSPREMKEFWSKALGVPLECIREVYFDPRTKGSPTRPGYHGVCAIMYFNSHLWRRLMAFSHLVCEIDLQDKGT